MKLKINELWEHLRTEHADELPRLGKIDNVTIPALERFHKKLHAERSRALFGRMASPRQEDA